MTAQQNTMWQSRVRKLLKKGLGSEDIAVIMECDVADVRQEIQILRDSRELVSILRCASYGETAKKLMV